MRLVRKHNNYLMSQIRSHIKYLIPSDNSRPYRPTTCLTLYVENILPYWQTLIQFNMNNTNSVINCCHLKFSQQSIIIILL